jgi:septum formation protein
VIPPERPEPRYWDGLPRSYAMRVASVKAEEVAERAGSGTVVAADTIVIVDGEVLGKPSSRADAGRMLGRLSGRAHEVLTAVCVRDADTGRMICASDRTRLWLRELGAEEVAAYLETPEPMDKAGAYALQGTAAAWVERLTGDPETVIGLPTRLVRGLLVRLGAV